MPSDQICAPDMVLLLEVGMLRNQPAIFLAQFFSVGYFLSRFFTEGWNAQRFRNVNCTRYQIFVHIISFLNHLRVLCVRVLGLFWSLLWTGRCESNVLRYTYSDTQMCKNLSINDNLCVCFCSFSLCRFNLQSLLSTLYPHAHPPPHTHTH